jgi:hypothetical protein
MNRKATGTLSRYFPEWARLAPTQFVAKFERNRLLSRPCHDYATALLRILRTAVRIFHGLKADSCRIPRFSRTSGDYTAVSSRQRQESSRIIPNVLRFIPNVLRFITISDDCLTGYPEIRKTYIVIESYQIVRQSYLNPNGVVLVLGHS